MKRLFAFLLALVMAMSILPTTTVHATELTDVPEEIISPAEEVSAQEDIIIEGNARSFNDARSATSGSCGTNATWSFSNGVLTISGTGATDSYDYNGGPWAEHKENITSIVIKSGITEIGNYAFYGCTSATSVSIANTVKVIGNSAFSACVALPRITIPSSVTTIGKYAFDRCRALATITIPSSVTSVGNYAFNCCNILNNVSWPSSVKAIGNGVFSNCIGLTSFTVPEGVTSIGEVTFNGCTSLVKVTLPSTLTTIGRRAFQDCYAFTTLNIPKSVTSIGPAAFARDPMGNFSVDAGNTSYCLDAVGALYSYDYSTIHAYPNTRTGSYTVDSRAKTIAEAVFYYCEHITELTFGENVSSIESEAMSNCNAMTRVNFKGSAPAINQYAFYDTTATCYYPTGDATWSESVRQQYGGTITWVAYDNGGSTTPDTSNYQLSVNSVQVTSKNAADVLGDGTVSYDAQTNTLTLNGANITKAENIDGDGRPCAILYRGTDHLTIVATGSNNISTLNNGVDQMGGAGSYGIYTTGDLTLKGDGYLRVAGATAIGAKKLYIGEKFDQDEQSLQLHLVLETRTGSVLSVSNANYPKSTHEYDEDDGWYTRYYQWRTSATGLFDNENSPDASKSYLEIVGGSNHKMLYTDLGNDYHKVTCSCGAVYRDQQRHFEGTLVSTKCSCNAQFALLELDTSIDGREPIYRNLADALEAAAPNVGQYPNVIVEIDDITLTEDATLAAGVRLEIGHERVSRTLTIDGATLTLENGSSFIVYQGVLNCINGGKIVDKGAKIYVTNNYGSTHTHNWTYEDNGDGTHTRVCKCTTCKITYYDGSAPTAHAAAAGAIATCKGHQCASCKAYFGEANLNADGHNYDSNNQCTLCGAVRVVSYDIYVAGIQISEDNMHDVLGDGTVSYDPDTSTLTLNGAIIDCSDKLPEDGISAYEELNIVVGTKGAIIRNCSYGIFTNDAVTITGGSLIIEDIQIAGIYTQSHDLIFNDANVVISTTQSGGHAVCTGTVGGTVYFNRSIAELHAGKTSSGSMYGIGSTIIVMDQDSHVIATGETAACYVTPALATGASGKSRTAADATFVSGVVYNGEKYFEFIGSSIILESAVTINMSQNGSVSTSHTSAYKDTEVTLTIVPNSGYRLEKLTVNGEDVTEHVSSGVYTFAMPNEDVTVSAVFVCDGHKNNTNVDDNDCTTAVICSVCQAIIKEAQDSHSIVTDTAVEAGCEDTGLTEGKHCGVCGKVLVAQEVIEATGHTEVIDAAVAPDCTNSGLTEGKYCSVCNKVLKAQDTVAALGHSYEAVVTDPTCTEEGYTTHTCATCSDSYTEPGAAKLGHNMGEWVVTEDPTCSEPGSKERSCLRGCGHIETESISSSGHSYNGTVTAPTCTADGYTTYVCEHCGDSYTEPGTAKLGHNMGEWVVTEDPTCSEPGSKERSCLRGCGLIETATVKPSGHSYNGSVTAPTCTADGYITYVCEHCGDSHIEPGAALLGHDMGQWVADGALERRDCSRCDHYDTRAIIPEAPAIKVANVASSGKPKITWNKVDGATKYKVYRSTDGGETYSLLSTTSGTSLTNTSTTAGSKYYYYVTAVNVNGVESGKSNVVNSVCDLPAPTVKIAVVASTGKLKLTWDKIDGAKNYSVYRSTDGGETYSLLSTTTGTSLTNTSATAGNMYYYKVKANHTNSSATSAYSSVVKGTCDLPRPTASVALNSSGKPVVTWEKVSGATKYTVYIYDADGNLLKTSSTTGTKLTHSSAVKGTTYSYQVVAVHSNSAANSAKSTAVSIKCTK